MLFALSLEISPGVSARRALAGGCVRVAAGVETGRLDGHPARVTALCLLPDGGLASGSGDNTIRLWDTSACAEIARLEGHLAPVAALCNDTTRRFLQTSAIAGL